MNLIDAFLHNPVKVSVGVLLVVLFGVIGLLRMPMQLTPEVQIPTITVETRWPGASPQEVEREIVQEQEDQLKSVEGVVKMSSECMDSVGIITLEFQVGANMQEALLKVNSRLQQVREYPEDADEPVITTSSAADRAIAWFILTQRMPSREDVERFQQAHPELAAELAPVLRAANPGLAELRLRQAAANHEAIRQGLLPPEEDMAHYRKFAEDYIKTAFERVRGVSSSNVFGGREPELQVVVDPERLAARGLTLAHVRDTLRAQNQDTSGGDIWEGKRRWVVRTLSQFTSPQQVEAQVLAISNGAPIYVRDVADVRLSFKKPDGFVRRFGRENLAVNAARETGANVLEVMRGLREMNERLNDGVLKDRGLVLTQVYDETEYIYSAIGLVNENIILGGALTVIVLMLFLHLGTRTLLVIPVLAGTAAAALLIHPWFFALTLLTVAVAGFWFARGALVVSLAIPVSIIGTFLLMQQMGRSLNVVSLAGLAFAVGMLVDNAIVVLENIYRHHEMGAGAFASAQRATKEVWGAVIASTLTTLAVFLPVLFIEEEAGQLFRDIALAISASVGLSMLVSVVVIPVAASRLLRREDRLAHEHVGDGRPRRHAHRWDRLVNVIASLGRRFGNHVVSVNHWILQGTFRRVGVVLALTALAVGLTLLLRPKIEYLPMGNRNLVACIIVPPPGYNVEKLAEMGETVESALRPYWDYDAGESRAKRTDFPHIADFFYVARGRTVFLGLRSADPARVDELIPLISGGRNPRNGTLAPGLGSLLPGAIIIANKTSLFEQGLTGGRSIDVEITGPDPSQLVAIGGRVFGGVMGGGPPGQERPPVVPGAQAQPIPSLDLANPEVRITPRLLQSRDMGMSATELGYAVNALVDGAYVSDYFVDGEKIDLSILGNTEAVRRTQDLAALTIATPGGQLVPLQALADIELTGGPEQINRRERQRAVTIRVKPDESTPLEDALERISAEIVEPLQASGQLGSEYMITLSGTADKLRDTWRALRWNFVLALLITYLLMAALFESWLYPLVIMFSVPLGAVGGVLGLRLLSLYLVTIQRQPPQALDVLTMLGFVILIGTVVNNAILIVHQALNHMRDEQMESRAAILASIGTRVRPIFMTTATTVFGLAPLVLFPGAGSELYRGLGSVVLGGLLVSTMFTLLLIPSLFSLVLDLQAYVLNLWRGHPSRRLTTRVVGEPSERETTAAASR